MFTFLLAKVLIGKKWVIVEEVVESLIKLSQSLIKHTIKYRKFKSTYLHAFNKSVRVDFCFKLRQHNYTI